MRAKTKSVAVLLASAMMLGSVNVWAVESPEASMTEQQETQQTAYEFSFEGFQSASVPLSSSRRIKIFSCAPVIAFT